MREVWPSMEELRSTVGKVEEEEIFTVEKLEQPLGKRDLS